MDEDKKLEIDIKWAKEYSANPLKRIKPYLGEVHEVRKVSTKNTLSHCERCGCRLTFPETNTRMMRKHHRARSCKSIVNAKKLLEEGYVSSVLLESNVRCYTLDIAKWYPKATKYEPLSGRLFVSKNLVEFSNWIGINSENRVLINYVSTQQRYFLNENGFKAYITAFLRLSNEEQVTMLRDIEFCFELAE